MDDDHDEYKFSCRAVVDLLNSVYESDFETARDGISDLVLEFVRGIGHEQPVIRAMSLLLQVPFGGECQVWHTDEDQDAEEVVYSFLIPCHKQSAPVFLSGIDPKLGPSGFKPLLSLGDMAYWDASAVKHAGSSAERVPVGQVLRVAIFVSVGTKRPEPGFQIIHSGPDLEQWTHCVHPIIRSCVRCRRGVQACEPDMKFCVRCLGSGEFQATAVVCRWCHESEDHLHCETMIGLHGGKDVVQAVWRGLGLESNAVGRRLCIHGNEAFQDMSLSQRLLLHFHEDELQRGFRFWSQFFLHFAPDHTIFSDGQRAALSEDDLWRLFDRKFVQSKRVKARCSRSLGILRVTSMICGFSSLLWREDTSIPVLMAVGMFEEHSVSYVEAFRIAKSNEDRLKLSHDDHRIVGGLKWLETKVETTHCSCGTTAPNQRASVSLSRHHTIKNCPGPTLVRSHAVNPQAATVWSEAFIAHVHKQGKLFVFFFYIHIFIVAIATPPAAFSPDLPRSPKPDRSPKPESWRTKKLSPKGVSQKPTQPSPRSNSQFESKVETTDLSELFQNLETLCESTYNLDQHASADWMRSVDAHLSNLPNLVPNNQSFEDANLLNREFMELAMRATGSVPVNVEGKGDCFFLAFWYGYAGGNLEDRAQWCLELRRLAAKVFLANCQRDPDLLIVLRSHDSFARIRDLADAEFIEVTFRNIGNFDKVRYPDDVSDLTISCLSEALQVRVCVWRLGSCGRPKPFMIGDEAYKSIVHVLYNGRDHYFAFDQERATATSQPKDCEFGVLARG
jgi:hypothetical protein